MTDLVPCEVIEEIVGVVRHATRHYARAVSAEQTVYILHSQRCKDSGRDLRDCLFSQALATGIEEYEWADAEDKAVRAIVTPEQKLVPIRLVDGTVDQRFLDGDSLGR